MIIYQITNTITGRSYIGMTAVPLARRWWLHQDRARKGVKTALYNSMRLHGFDVFCVTEIATLLPKFGRKALGALEQQIIAQQNSLVPNGYNMTCGGDGLLAGAGNPNNGRKASPEKIAKIKAGWTPERKALAAEMMRGRKGEKRSAQAIANQKASWTPERRRQTSIRFVGLANALNARPEHKDRIRKMFKDLWNDPDFRAMKTEQNRQNGLKNRGIKRSVKNG